MHLMGYQSDAPNGISEQCTKLGIRTMHPTGYQNDEPDGVSERCTQWGIRTMDRMERYIEWGIRTIHQMGYQNHTDDENWRNISFEEGGDVLMYRYHSICMCGVIASHYIHTKGHTRF